MIKKDYTFEQWCYSNLDIDYANEILSRWDVNKNGCLSSEAFKVTGINEKGYYFKCNNNPNHYSEQKRTVDFIKHYSKGLTNTRILDCNQCNSFAQWGIDNLGNDFLEKYWDYDKNEEINPFTISWGCHYEIYIKCQTKNYHVSYNTSPNSFTTGYRCPYCSGKKVHPLDSVGSLYSKSLTVWSDKNKKSSYEYAPMSGKKVWWKCPDGIHKDFKRSISESTLRDFRCSECDYSKGENQISKFLLVKNIEYIPQKEFDGLTGIGKGNLSYDFYLPLHNMLIEYDGEFHYRAMAGKKQFEKQQEHDRRKNEFAKNNDIILLRIPYWDFDNIENILNNSLEGNK